MNVEDRRRLVSAFVLGLISLILWIMLQYFI